MIYTIYLENNNSLELSMTDQAKRNLERLKNQVYKLLPNREEGIDWARSLDSIIEEFCGMYKVLQSQQDIIFSIICKLEGLYILTEYEHYGLFRKTIFECLSLITQLTKQC